MAKKKAELFVQGWKGSPKDDGIPKVLKSKKKKKAKEKPFTYYSKETAVVLDAATQTIKLNKTVSIAELQKYIIEEAAKEKDFPYTPLYDAEAKQKIAAGVFDNEGDGMTDEERANFHAEEAALWQNSHS